MSTATQRDDYIFRLEFRDERQSAIHSATLAPSDFRRAIAETTFAAFQRGQLAEYAPPWGEARVDPQFSAEESGARAAGFRVSIPLPDGRDFVKDFSFGYFAAEATRQRAKLLQHENWPQDRTLYYNLAAYLEDSPSPSRGPSGLTVAAETIHVPVSSSSRCEFPQGEPWDAPRTDDLAVFICRSVLEQACEESQRNSQREIGGLLLGNLLRDPATGEVALKVTCLVSGEGTTDGTESTVTFTAETFAAARRLASLRATPSTVREFVVGNQHSHPFRLCADCPLPTPPECVSKILFFSADDIQLMESTFFQPFHVALLTAVESRLETPLGHLPVKLFGWRNGEVVGRGFQVFDE